MAQNTIFYDLIVKYCSESIVISKEDFHNFTHTERRQFLQAFSLIIKNFHRNHTKSILLKRYTHEYLPWQSIPTMIKQVLSILVLHQRFITYIDFPYYCINSHTAIQLMASYQLKFIRNICIQGTYTLKTIQLIVKSDWKYLKQLDIRSNTLSNKGLAVLMKGNWKYLEQITLSTDYFHEKFITNDGHKLFSKCKLNAIKRIAIHDNKYQINTFIFFKQMSKINLKNVQCIDIGNCDQLPVTTLNILSKSMKQWRQQQLRFYNLFNEGLKNQLRHFFNKTFSNYFREQKIDTYPI